MGAAVVNSIAILPNVIPTRVEEFLDRAGWERRARPPARWTVCHRAQVPALRRLTTHADLTRAGFRRSPLLAASPMITRRPLPHDLPEIEAVGNQRALMGAFRVSRITV